MRRAQSGRTNKGSRRCLCSFWKFTRLRGNKREMIESSYMEAVTLAIALLGAALGILNTWRAMDRDKPKFRVGLVYATPWSEQFTDIQFIGIEVTNLSAFPLTVVEVGLNLKRTSDRLAFLPRTERLLGDTIPCRIQAREQKTFYERLDAIPRDRPFSSVYAKTACGLVFKVKSRGLPSPVLRQDV
jgi:hypothetical protein